MRACCRRGIRTAREQVSYGRYALWWFAMVVTQLAHLRARVVRAVAEGDPSGQPRMQQAELERELAEAN